MHSLETGIDRIIGNENDSSYSYLGIPFAHANRFEYAKEIETYDDVIDATKWGKACVQKRCYYPHYENPTRKFYFREFREGIDFQYAEDCLNLNIYTPKAKGKYPVLVFIHGGGFDSGANSESGFRGDKLAKLGIVTVFIQYRVGVLGYFTHEDLNKEFGHEGNFGFDDQVIALKWIKKHIGDFDGDADNITVMGQSAGAMSIQSMLLSKKCKPLIDKAIMISGGGLFPKIATPKPVEERREYWLDVMNECGCKTLDEFRKIEIKKIFDALEVVKARRKDNQISTMTMIDHYYLTDEQKKTIFEKNDIPTIISFTNNDMYTILLAQMALKYAKKHHAYCYYFDVDAKGDHNKAFHSSDIRYLFGELEDSWRNYDEKDTMISSIMMDYIANFCRSGNPNGKDLPLWEIIPGKALCIHPDCIKMGRPNKLKLLRNTFLGDPKNEI